MLKLLIPKTEMWDEEKQEFVYTNSDTTLLLEHSLISLSKWESRNHKAFLNSSKSNGAKTFEETMDYIRCMTINNVDPSVYSCLTNRDIYKINQYIDDPMTATYISDAAFPKAAPNRDIVTSELIYYWMIALNIPFECEKWHLNRLFSLIKVCNLKNASNSRKLSRSDIAARNRKLNAERRAKLHSRG